MIHKLKIIFLVHWKSLLLFIVVFTIISNYVDLVNHILEASQLSNCISNDENLIKPCKKQLDLSGKLIALFSLISIAMIIFRTEKDLIIKFLFVYYSAITVLYTTRIGYTDIEQQKVQLELNKQYHTAKQENEILNILKSQNINSFENNLTIKKLEIGIDNMEIYYQVLQEESKVYLQYKVTASFAIIVLSFILLLILFLKLNINKLYILCVFIILHFMAYPQI